MSQIEKNQQQDYKNLFAAINQASYANNDPKYSLNFSEHKKINFSSTKSYHDKDIISKT